MNLGVLKLVSFLNDFDKNVRQKISKLDEKLTKLERTVEQVESIKQSRKLKNVSN
jgi:cell division protein ZapA (FtsZ GTPase activity inhibitor)